MRPQYIYKPQEDITVWELAQVLKAFLDVNVVDTFPPEVKRHFIDKNSEVKEALNHPAVKGEPAEPWPAEMISKPYKEQ